MEVLSTNEACTSVTRCMEDSSGLHNFAWRARRRPSDSSWCVSDEGSDSGAVQALASSILARQGEPLSAFLCKTESDFLCDSAADELFDAICSVRSLDLSALERLTDCSLRRFATRCMALVNLRLSNCIFLSDLGVAEVAGHCTLLQALDVSHCIRLTDASVISIAALQYLTELSISCCYEVTSIRPLEHLHSLDISGCTSVTDAGFGHLADRMPGLRELNLSGCCALSDSLAELQVALRLPAMSNMLAAVLV